jgi:ankyrin repeat protein
LDIHDSSHLLRRFRWVYCQILYLRSCLSSRIRHALEELPETLDETYGRALRDIEKVNWELAYRLLQCVAVASRPLRVVELAEILSFDFETGTVPKFREDWRLQDPLEAVLSTTSSLLAIVDVSGSAVVQFSHFSVKEFLTSTRLAETNDIICRRYHISMTPAHTLAAQACLGILLHLDGNVVNRDGLERYPLAAYAAKHWVDHAQFEGVSENVKDGMKRLFDPRKPHLAIWVWIHEPEWPPSSGTSRTDMPLQPRGSPLHYAALYGLPSIVQFLVIRHSQDVHLRGFDQRFAPLHLASQQGHDGVVRLLFEYGADPTPKANDGSTPLHLTSHKEVTRMLLKHGADTTARNEEGWSPLHSQSYWGRTEITCLLLEHGADLAARANDMSTTLHLASNKEVASLLLKHGADTTAQTKDGWTPLHSVSYWGRAEIARLLFESGADPTAQANDGSTALHLASNEEVTRVLLDHGADMAAKNMEGWAPLHSVSYWGRADIAWLLLEHGADSTAQANDRSTALHLASSGKVTRVLLDHGADIAAKNKEGWAPLHSVSYWGRAEIARFLLEHGADLTARSNDRSTALHLASNKDVARLLLEHGTDTTAQNREGWTPLHSVSYWGRAEVARLLLEHGSDIAARSNDRSTALHLSSNQEVARVLLEHGADTAARNKEEWTPLHSVSYWGRAEIARLLLDSDHGVDLAARSKDGSTALHLASTREIALELLEHGADITAENKGGWTPLHSVSYWGHAEIVRLLLEHGADPAARTNDGSTALGLASNKGVTRALLAYGANTRAQTNDG